MQNDTYKPRHIEEKNPVKRAWDWITGKSESDDSLQITPSPITFDHANLFARYDLYSQRTGKEKRGDSCRLRI